ncbi:MAG: leucine-rich repeat domain-containing protein [Cyanobacteria bacterium P01_F01_bin.4]
MREISHIKYLYLDTVNLQSYSFLSGLIGLTALYLGSNRITDFSFLSGLTGLTTLDLSDNRIRQIPQLLAAGRMAIEVESQFAPNCINLTDNPIEEPPLEIVRQGNAAILNYYDQLTTQGTDHLYEAKMLIVGEGEAGKTTLAHKIPEPDCPLPHVDDRTRGISIQTHAFPCRKQDPSEDTASRNFHLRPHQIQIRPL